MFDLKKLRQKRKEILKAELAAWLHDVGKLHVGHQSKYLRDKPRSNYLHTRFGPSRSERFLETFSKTVSESSLLSISIKLEHLIREHHKRVGGNCNSPNPIICLIQRMDWLDSEYDRADIVTFGYRTKRKLVQPTSSGFGLFSAFGFENHLYKWSKDIELIRLRQANCNKEQIDALSKLLCFLQQRLSSFQSEVSYAERNKSLTLIRVLFSKAAGDTRYSVNDISLWEHSQSVSLLSKAFVSWCISNELTWNSLLDKGTTIQKKIQNHSKFRRWFRPQLLPLRVDGLKYLTRSINIPDLLARRSLLQEVYDSWRDILEWEFPTAGEIYRDENGPVFLTFLRDEKGENVVHLKELKLPKVSDDGNEGKDSVVPDVRKISNNLEDYLRKAVIYKTEGDLSLPPSIKLFTYEQNPKEKRENDKSLGDILKEEYKQGLWLEADISRIKESWDDLQKLKSKFENSKFFLEVCEVCGLRPKGYATRNIEKHLQEKHEPKKQPKLDCDTCKAISRRMCGVCLNRREKRAEKWAQGIELSSEERFLKGHPETVWLDEVADENGRIALIVGYFQLENWLDGSLVESLAMFKRDKCCENNTECQGTSHKWVEISGIKVCLGPKPVSYSRIRRVWETTRRFWQDVAPTDAPPEELQDLLQNKEFGLSLKNLWEGPLSLENSLAGKIVGKSFPRILIKGQLSNELGPYHAYEIEIKGQRVAVLWDDERKGLWIIENPEYFKERFDIDFQEELTKVKSIEIYEPSEYGKQREPAATIDQIKIEIPPESGFIPLIPILAEPQVFMAIVPANKAFEVVKAIKTKYEREMGKVRNRLPLHIGVVYAYRKMPLRAILDAGRKMLEQKWEPDDWQVVNIKTFGQPNNPNERKGWRALHLLKRKDLIEEHPDQFRVTHCVLLKKKDEKFESRFIWYVPAVMGDGQTEDHWYPYVFLESPGEPTDRNRYYKAVNPWNSSHSWLVHAGELEAGDRIYFTPATFDFEFLDTNARRFEIAYDKNGKRRNSLTKPYLLDEVEILDKIWKFLTQKQNGKPRLSTTQIFALREIIETKREEWFDEPHNSLADENFKKFCHDLFVNAQWQWGKPDKSKLQWLADMAVRGYFTDAVYLFHHVMKGKVDDHTETR